MMNLAYRAAEAGQSNDWILRALNNACDLWSLYPNLFERWTKLLGMLRRIRQTYPNQADGSGWKP